MSPDLQTSQHSHYSLKIKRLSTIVIPDMQIMFITIDVRIILSRSTDISLFLVLHNTTPLTSTRARYRHVRRLSGVFKHSCPPRIMNKSMTRRNGENCWMINT